MTELLKRPRAILPIGMSAAALATVVGYAVTFGTARQVDEGAAAHIWQLLIVEQLPGGGCFRRQVATAALKQALGVLALQADAALPQCCLSGVTTGNEAAVDRPETRRQPR
jgi:hypothetical protein